MIVEDFKISERLEGSAIISWTSLDANNVSWLFVNGYLIHGPIFTETTQRQIAIRFSRGLNKAIEIHDFADTDIRPGSVAIKEFERPTIEWIADGQAIKYRVYHTPFGAPEVLLATVELQELTTRYTLNCPVRLVEGWHYFRVESVNEFGIESTREIWRYRAFRIPKPVKGLTVSNGSGAGLFDIEITV